MRIIYPQENDTVAIIVPAPHITDMGALAKKRVPSGKAYRIVQDSDIPTDRTLRNSWTADFSNPDGYGEGE